MNPLRERRWIPVAVLGADILLMVAATWPLALHPASRAIWFDGDPLLNATILAWVQHALLHDPANLFNPHFMYPGRGMLCLSENLIVPAILTLPLAPLKNPVLVYNAVWALALIGSSWAWRRVLRLWGLPLAAAWMGGIMFGFSPWRIGQMSHLQLLCGWWIPLALAGTDGWLRGKGRGRALLTGGALAAQFYSCFYLFVFLGLFLVPFALTGLALIRPPRTAWRGLALQGGAGLMLAALLLAPAAGPYAATSELLGEAVPLHTLTRRGAVLTDYLRAPQENLMWGRFQLINQNNLSDVWWENSLWPGWTTLLFGASAPFALRRRRGTPERAPEEKALVQRMTMLAAGGGVLFVLSFGPVLYFRGNAVCDLPWYRWLFERMPAFNAIRVPARAGSMAIFALTGLAAAAAAHWIALVARRSGARRAAWAGAALVAIAGADAMNASLPVWENAAYERHRRVHRDLPGGSEGTVLTLPIDMQTDFGAPLAATVNFKPTPNGISGHFPASTKLVRETLTEPVWGPRQAELIRWLGVRWLVADDRVEFSTPPSNLEEWLAANGLVISTKGYPELGIAVYELKQDPEALAPPPAPPDFDISIKATSGSPQFLTQLEYRSSPALLTEAQRQVTLTLKGMNGLGDAVWNKVFRRRLPQFILNGQRLDFPLEIDAGETEKAVGTKLEARIEALGVELTAESRRPSAR